MNETMLPLGTMLHGIYRVERYIASGGFGNTYEVTNVEFGEKRAMKEFFMKGINEREDDHTTVSVSNEQNSQQYIEQLEKFKKEARRLRRLDSQHIVKVHDLFEENGTCYYVMDYIDGESLSARFKRTGKPLEENEMQSIFTQMLDALEEVHHAQLWHLDIKPANIMLDSNGKVRLIDFGASKQLSSEAGATTSTALCYTPGYAPPEQVEQNMEKCGPWTDLYALGATMFFLLTGQRPPLASDINEDAQKAFSPLTPFSQPMQSLVKWLMQPNRQDRPQSVQQIRQMMQTPDDITFIHQGSKHSSRKTSRMAIIIGVAAVAIVVAAVLLLPSKKKKADNDSLSLEMEMEEYREEPQLETPTDTLAYTIGMAQTEGLTEYLATSLSVDTTYMSEFAQGLLQGAMLSFTQPDAMEKEARTAYNAGIQIGSQIEKQFIPNINKQVFVDDSTQTISLQLFMAGFVQGIYGDEPLMTRSEAQETATRLMKQIKDEHAGNLYADNKREGELFLKENAKEPDVVTLTSGVQYKVLREGRGRKPASQESMVTVDYEGRLIDGTVFDSSYERGDAATFRLNQVIKGWTDALLQMPVGSKWEIYIPHDLAYGSQQQGDIKPFSTLIFTVELLSLKDEDR